MSYNGICEMEPDDCDVYGEVKSFAKAPVENTWYPVSRMPVLNQPSCIISDRESEPLLVSLRCGSLAVAICSQAEAVRLAGTPAVQKGGI